MEVLCKEYDRPMPTEIKMIYDVNDGSLSVDYKYEPVYSQLKICYLMMLLKNGLKMLKDIVKVSYQ